MAKDIDDLLRDVFGGGKNRTISTQKAETYLQQSKRVNRGLDTLEEQQKAMDAKLKNQLEELKKMSSELDFDRIQTEVERDFGVKYQPVEKTAPQPAKQETDSRPEAQRFSDLLPKLAAELVGQEAFLKKLVIALKRPYIMGWDAPHGLRNAILIHGKPNSGRHTALQLAAEGMKAVDLLSEAQSGYASAVCCSV